jgi:hypothetical protein
LLEGILERTVTQAVGATGGYGTALGVIRSAYAKQPVKVYAGETRPWLQVAAFNCLGIGTRWHTRHINSGQCSSMVDEIRKKSTGLLLVQIDLRPIVTQPIKLEHTL